LTTTGPAGAVLAASPARIQAGAGL